MTLSRIQELESLGFEWKVNVGVIAWEDRLRELADYRKIHGHCNVPISYSENTKLATWVATQRKQYKMHREGKTSHMSLSRIQELESLGFEWCRYVSIRVATSWEDRLSELADYHKIHGHCNVPKMYRESIQLGNWVATQRTNYRFHLEGKRSSMTLSRIQELESLGLEWKVYVGVTAWEDRLSELADYRKIHGDCNVPKSYIKNAKLATWVSTQRTDYRLQQEGNAHNMTLSRIQELESLGFDWKPPISRRQGSLKDDALVLLQLSPHSHKIASSLAIHDNGTMV